MTKTATLRPAWTPLTTILMIVGFMIAWPLGLAMLAYILWGDRLPAFRDEVDRAADSVFKSCRGRRYERTGNVAFDDWREAELDRLAEERRKLDEMRKEFDDYMRELRRAKDQEEFEAFMNRDKTPPQAPTANKRARKRKTVPDTSE